MDAFSCDSTASTAAALPRSRRANTASVGVILSVLRPDSRAFRRGNELLSGTRACEWRTGDFAKLGHAEMLRIRLARIETQPSIHGDECDSEHANQAAKNGFLDVIQVLRTHGIHCTSTGADWAAWKGHLAVIRDLRQNSVHCTSTGADLAASSGHLHVIRDLRSSGVDCTSGGADHAAMNGHLTVVRDLREHGIHCTEDGAFLAAVNGRLEVFQDLEEHGIAMEQSENRRRMTTA